MMKTENPTEPLGPSTSTNVFASGYLVKPQTVLKRYSNTGSYFGIKPIKLPNGRLAWPTTSAQHHSLLETFPDKRSASVTKASQGDCQSPPQEVMTELDICQYKHPSSAIKASPDNSLPHSQVVTAELDICELVSATEAP